MAPSESKGQSRRGFLTLAAAAGAAGAGSRLFAPARGSAAPLSSGDPIPEGESSVLPGTVTILTATSVNGNIVLVNPTTDPALVVGGESQGLVAYDSYSSSTQPAPPTGKTAGILAAGQDFGTLSRSTTGVGIQGETSDRVGVRGQATGAGLALESLGPVRFSSAGRGTIAKNQSKVTVSGVAVSAKAKILVTLMDDPGPGNTVKLAKRLTATSFEVQLLASARVRTRFSYFVIS